MGCGSLVYLAAVKTKNACRAAVWAAALIVLSGVNVVSYVQNHWFLIAAALGAAAGTYTFMKLHRE